MKIFVIGSVASMMINFRQELIKRLSQDGFEVYCLVCDYDQESKSIIQNMTAQNEGGGVCDTS